MIENADDLTRAVSAVMARTQDPRLREIMVSLVRHLHGFVREVGLTEAEFRQAGVILNELGQLGTASHNEVVLMAGSLGLSQLVCLINNGEHGQRPTPQNLLGPFWRMHSPATDNGASIVRSPTPGLALEVQGEVVDAAGWPVAGAEVDIWHASPVGLYEQQDPQQADMNLRGKFVTDADGRFWFTTVRPAGYPIPTTGVVGRLLAAQGRHPMRPAHLHALVFKPGFKTLITQLYDADDPHLDTDVQFGATRATTVRYQRQGEGQDDQHPALPDVAAPWYRLDYRFALEPGDAMLPRPPIR